MKRVVLLLALALPLLFDPIPVFLLSPVLDISSIFLLRSSLLILLVLHLMGMGMKFVTNDTLRAIIGFISFDARLTPFTRGLVTTRDLVYFLSITLGCLMASFRALERRKWA